MIPMPRSLSDKIVRSVSPVLVAELDAEGAHDYLEDAPQKEALLATRPAQKNSGEVSGEFCKLALPVFLPQFPAYGVNGLITPVLPAYVMHHFGRDAATAGIATACMSLAPVVLDLPQNIVADRVGPHLLGVAAAVCLVACGVVGVMSDLSNCFALFLVSRVLNGMGQSAWQISRVLLLARAPTSLRAKALSCVGGVQRLGNMVGPLIGSLMTARFTIYGVFACQLACGLFLLPLALWPVLAPATAPIPDFARGSGVGGEGKQSSVGSMMVCAARNWTDLATAGLACLALCWLRQTKDFLIVLKINDLGGGAELCGLAVSMAYFFDVAFAPVSGWLMTRFGRKYSLAPALAVVGLGCGALATPLAASPWHVLGLACVCGAGNGITSGLGMTMGSDIAVKLEKQGLARSKAEFLGPWREMQDLGMFLGPAVSGAVVAALSFKAAAGSCAALGVVGAVFTVFLVRETLVQSSAKSGAA
uniref:Major facilitator superfamily (MFS) profile domain-containing protein n=1 Tax=Zooxanthella nutricula TaxID=1333877 RepID=A0A7S2NC60_9DINO